MSSTSSLSFGPEGSLLGADPGENGTVLARMAGVDGASAGTGMGLGETGEEAEASVAAESELCDAGPLLREED